jgi:hypothetical protein
MKTLLTTTMALGVIMALETSNPVKAAVDAEAVEAQQQGPVDQAGWVRFGAPRYWHAAPYGYRAWHVNPYWGW